MTIQTQYFDGVSAWPQNYLDNLEIRYGLTEASQIRIYSGRCRSDDNTTNLESTNTLTVDMTVSGANGLDTGSEASSTWYYVWLIYNPTTSTYAGLFSLSSTSPTMPSGYTKKRRVGSIRNDSSSNFFIYSQVEKTGRHRQCLYDLKTAASVMVLNGGTAVVYTTVDCSVFIPATAEWGIFEVLFSSNSPTKYVSIRPYGYVVDPSINFQYGGGSVSVSATSNARRIIRTASSQRLQYCNSAAGGFSYIYAIGWVETL